MGTGVRTPGDGTGTDPDWGPRVVDRVVDLEPSTRSFHQFTKVVEVWGRVQSL